MKEFKKVLSTVLCLIMLFGIVAVGGDGFADLFEAISVKASASYSVGDIIYYGTYPQSDVTSSLGSALNSQNGTWKSYNYYSGTGHEDDGKMTASDYMRYKDVTYNGNKYRGVTFDSYRPCCTGYTSSDNNQQSNGYYTGITYWFKYEPLKWRVLDSSTGLVMCDSIIDSQAYNNYVLYAGYEYWGNSGKTYYASNYAKSSIRQWLNNDFYNTAFSDEQKSNIKTTTLNNNGYCTLTGTSGYEKYDAPSTADKIFLLSYDEVKNSAYGFASSASNYDTARRLHGSDYAKCQGLRVYKNLSSADNGNSDWWLRSPDYSSASACSVRGGGNAYRYCITNGTNFGVCPALKLLNLKSDTDGSEIELKPVDVENEKISFKIDGNDGTTTVTFKNEWFDHSSGYNHGLAQFCADYAMMGYSYSDSVVNCLKKAGFEITSDYYNMSSSRDQVNYFIATRDIVVNGEANKLVFVGTIGSYKDQWFSNFDPKGYNNAHKDKSLADGSAHRGFADARDYVFSKLTLRIKELIDSGISRNNIQILLTGHSRGAATANLLAAQLIDNAYDDRVDRLIDKNNIYAYTFATPNTVLKSKADVDADKYACIHNILNPEDFVTKVLLKSWGFSRYGKSYCLPSYTNTDYSRYKRQLQAMNTLYGKYNKDKEYKPYMHGKAGLQYFVGEKPVHDLIIEMGDRIKTLDQFYTKHDAYGQGTMYDYFRNSLCPILANLNNPNFELVTGTLTTLISDFLPFTLKKDVTDFFAKHIFDFIGSHDMRTYCAYVKSLESWEVRAHKSTKYNSINCPVDIEVYNKETGNLVGKIKDNVIDETVQASAGAIVMDVEGDSKSFWLPSDGDYRVVLTGNDSGTMDYTVSQIDSDIGEISRVNFYDVEIKDGVSMSGEFNESLTDLSGYTLTLSDGSKLAPTENIEEESKEYQIFVTTNGFGYATESRTAISGDFVSLEAYPVSGSTFLGWYENNKLISTKTEYSFVAKSNRSLESKFSNPTASTTLHIPSNTTVEYSSKVTIKATATDVPSGYYVALYDGSTLLEKGSNTEVSYTFPGEFKSAKNLTIKIIDGSGNVQKDGSGKDLTASFTVKAKTGFFAKLVAFFRRLFGSLPAVTVEPK